MSGEIRPDRHALLGLDALLHQIGALRDEGDADRFGKDSRYRWVLHRLWIAAGNEALAYTAATGQGVRADRTGPTSTTCATTSPIPGSPTSTKHSSAASPGLAPARSGRPSKITCAEARHGADGRPIAYGGHLLVPETYAPVGGLCFATRASGHS